MLVANSRFVFLGLLNIHILRVLPKNETSVE